EEGASAWIAHSKLSKTCVLASDVSIVNDLSYSLPQTSQIAIEITSTLNFSAPSARRCRVTESRRHAWALLRLASTGTRPHADRRRPRGGVPRRRLPTRGA